MKGSWGFSGKPGRGEWGNWLGVLGLEWGRSYFVLRHLFPTEDTEGAGREDRQRRRRA